VHARAEVLRLGRRWSEALVVARHDIAYFREMTDDRGLAIPIGNLGAIRLRLGHHGPAGRLLLVANALNRRHGNRHGEAITLNELAILDREQGRIDEALRRHERALRILRDLGSRFGECEVLNALARTLQADADLAGAMELYRRVVEVGHRHHYPPLVAEAYQGLADCLAARADPLTDRYRRLADQLYQQMESVDGSPRGGAATAAVAATPAGTG
jgi:tetratricopeptide (TPR) repeat protein